MIDGIMVSLLQGDSGSYRHLCHNSRNDANNVVIADGFDITKSYQTCKKAWDKLVNNEIVYKSSERQGQCHPHLVEGDLHCFAILHFKLRSLDFAQKILYRLECSQYDWRDDGLPSDMARILKGAKQRCIDHVRHKAEILMDTPGPNGGNTNNGPLADRFFHPSNRTKISSVIKNSKDRENFEIFMAHTNIILTITQSITKKKVKISKLKTHGIELMLHLRNSFLDHRGKPWIMIIPSFHQMCAHSWEMFEMNGGQSIAKWSESPVECWNKHVRSFQSGPAARSRQSSVKYNIHDVLKMMLVMTHPAITSRRPRPSSKICGEVGHTARSFKHKLSFSQTEEQSIIESMYY